LAVGARTSPILRTPSSFVKPGSASINEAPVKFRKTIQIAVKVMNR
jgi:hypothetical protein